MLILKSEVLKQYRNRAQAFYERLRIDKTNYKEQAKRMNQFINEQKEFDIRNQSVERNSTDKLNNILMITYVANVVMLEYRNKIWNYDYMAFSRRIGEIWEPFCKLPFEYPVRELEIVPPFSFDDFKMQMIENMDNYIESLELSAEDISILENKYREVWSLIDSGSINLSLDLHFRQDGIIYNIDYKSGFSSNEKGNTNRLLLVGSIYNSLSNTYRNLIFVRQREEENNHYLITLKNSPYWDVYCFNDAYDMIHRFTGFDLKHWMSENMNWNEDISEEFKKYLIQNELFNYLTW